jgi:type III secretion system low calcium response chaperone LcrH/SycD
MTAEATLPPTATAPVSVLLEGGRYKDVAGLTDGDIETLYYLAYTQYSQGQFADAEKTFRVLCFHDHLSDRFWLGLGAARQMLKDHEGAILAYSMIPEIGSFNPLAPLHAAECYLALGLYEQALAGLDCALECAGNAEEPEAVVKHIEVVFEALEHLVAALPDDPPAAEDAK